MIDPRQIIPLLSNMTVDRPVGQGPSGSVYQVTRKIDNKKLALKHVSIPTKETETQALIYSGAVKNEAEALKYFHSQVKDLKNELLMLNNVKNPANLLRFRGYQVDQKFVGLGYDVYLLSDFCKNLPDYLQSHRITKLEAVNLAIDLCSALDQLRSAGLIHKNVHPRNVFMGSGEHFLLGDFGVVAISELSYSAMPDKLITAYTAPEVTAGNASLSETMDIYSVGIILYEIYNGGLPLDENGRFTRKKKKPLAQPQYADVAISEIILRACSLDPAERYQTPDEMKQALILYMQRGDVSGEYLIPPPPEPEPEPEPEPVPEPDAAKAPETKPEALSAEPAKVQDENDASVNIAEIAAAIEAGQEAEGIHNNAPYTSDSEVQQSAEESEEVPAEPPAPKHTLNDLKDDDLIMPAAGEISLEEFMASLRKSGLEVLSMDNEGNMSSVPGYETEETLPEDTEFVESADNFAVIQNLDAERSETPAAADDGLDITVDDIPDDYVMPETIDLPEDLLNETEGSQSNEQPPQQEEKPRPKRRADRPDTAPQQRHNRRPRPQEDINYYEGGAEDVSENDEDEFEESRGSTWKKILITVIVLLVLAGGSFALYTFKSDTINSVEPVVLSSTSVQILADTKNDSGMEVICSNATEEVARLPYTSDGVTFTDLNPNTTYTFTLASSEGKILLGSKTVEAKTNQMTQLNSFAASSISSVSATLALGGTGPQPEKWVVTVTSDSGENIVAESETYEIFVDGLTPETNYTATVAKSDGDVLGGTTTCTFTTQAYTTLSRFEASDVDTGSVTVEWDYSGTVPDSWTVTCDGTDGTSTSQEVSGNSCVLDGLVSGESYTLKLSCPSLKETELSTIVVDVPSVNITDMTTKATSGNEIEVSWEYEGDVDPASWKISYAYILSSGETSTPVVVSSDETSVTLTDLVPNTDYEISIVGADDLSVGGVSETSCETGSAAKFTDYGCSDAELSLYVLEDNTDGLEDETTEFTTSEHIAFAIQVSYDETEEEKSVSATYVIRDSSGNLVRMYRSDTDRHWDGSWTTARHTGDLPDCVETPGSYTLEVYFNGQLLAEKDFTVS